MSLEDGITVVRRNTEEVQSRNFQVFEELFPVDFVDHSNQRLSEEF
jgi:hypothetical protein